MRPFGEFFFFFSCVLFTLLVIAMPNLTKACPECCKTVNVKKTVCGYATVARNAP